MEKILVIIPAYEDDLLIDTIDSCLEKAQYPERIAFSIGLQYKNPPPSLTYPYDWFTMRFSNVKKEKFKIINYNVNNRPGLTRIMHDLCRQHTDEDYILMINAHTYFTENWDSLTIDTYKELKDNAINKKVILSSTSSTPPGYLEENNRSIVSAFFVSEKYLKISYQVTPTKVESDFVLSHLGTTIFFFTEKEYIYEDVFDNISDVGCIEPNLSFYSYIMGWDIYQYTKTNFAFHAGDNQWKTVINENNKRVTIPNGDPRYWKDGVHKIWSHSCSRFYSLDLYEDIWTHLLYSNNLGILRKHPKKIERSAGDFFKAIGLYDGYLERCKNTPQIINEANNILFN